MSLFYYTGFQPRRKGGGRKQINRPVCGSLLIEVWLSGCPCPHPSDTFLWPLPSPSQPLCRENTPIPGIHKPANTHMGSFHKIVNVPFCFMQNPSSPASCESPSVISACASFHQSTEYSMPHSISSKSSSEMAYCS